MNSLKQNAAHIVMATVVIGAVIVLTLHGNMDGQTSSAIIVAVGGFSLGGGVASSSAGAAASGSGGVPTSGGTSSSVAVATPPNSPNTEIPTNPTNTSSVL